MNWAHTNLQKRGTRPSASCRLSFIGGSETVFDYPGIGRWGVTAAQQLDIPGVMGSALLSSILFVGANLAADILYAWADPRIRIR